MKHLTITLLALMMTVAGMQAQTKGENREMGQRPHPTYEQIVEFQCNKLLEELALDDATAAQFKVVYKAYQDELQALRKKYYPARKPSGEKPSAENASGEKRQPKRQEMTDEEVETMILNQFAQSREMVDIRENYYKKFRTFLTPRQAQKIFRQEQSFGHGMRSEQARRQGQGFGQGQGYGHGQGMGQGRGQWQGQRNGSFDSTDL